MSESRLPLHGRSFGALFGNFVKIMQRVQIRIDEGQAGTFSIDANNTSVEGYRWLIVERRDNAENIDNVAMRRLIGRGLLTPLGVLKRQQHATRTKIPDFHFTARCVRAAAYAFQP